MLFSEKLEFLIFVEWKIFGVQITRQRQISPFRNQNLEENPLIGHGNPPIRGGSALGGDQQRVLRYPSLVLGGFNESVVIFKGGNPSCILLVPLSAGDL